RQQLYLASLLLLAGIGIYCVSLGLPVAFVVFGLAIVAGLTLVTGTNTVKPRNALVAMTRFERGLTLGGLLAVITIHSVILQWSITEILAR
ncbi:MAG: hypothetical protein AAFR27_13090, partial [Pseudomonadota bacterium]